MYENDHGLPKPRHSYIHVPQPGRRGILVHNGQIANGATPTGVSGGMSYGYGAGYGMGMTYGNAGCYSGVYPSTFHTYPLYYGPNVTRSTYTPGYFNYPSYNYCSPYYSYASHGMGYSIHANYYQPYQRSYYYPPAIAAPAYGYTYPVPATTTYTTHMPMTTTTQVPTPMIETKHSRVRDDIQLENRRVATERGAYCARNIRPADALPDDPFWCKERGGEWHLRTFYQIENECHPGRWFMDPDHGFLVFHRT